MDRNKIEMRRATKAQLKVHIPHLWTPHAVTLSIQNHTKQTPHDLCLSNLISIESPMCHGPPENKLNMYQVIS